MLKRIRGGLSPSEWATVGGMAAVVVGLHVVGFFLLFAFVVPRHFDLGDSGVFGVGLGLTAYTLGCATRSTPTTSARSTTPRASS